VRRAYTEGLIRSFAAHARVQLVGSPRLAAMAEASLRGYPVADEEVLGEIRPCFVEEAGRRTDIVVLACTHYPFLATRFRKLAPWPVDWLDPAEAIVARAASLLPGAAPGGPEEEARTGPEPDLAVFTAGPPDASTRGLIRGFGLDAGTMPAARRGRR
jgi:glutamate racemase